MELCLTFRPVSRGKERPLDTWMDLAPMPLALMARRRLSARSMTNICDINIADIPSLANVNQLVNIATATTK